MKDLGGTLLTVVVVVVLEEYSPFNPCSDFACLVHIKPALPCTHHQMTSVRNGGRGTDGSSNNNSSVCGKSWECIFLVVVVNVVITDGFSYA